MLEGWENVPLGQIVKFTSGKTKPATIVNMAANGACYPVFGGNGVLGWAEEFNAEGENIIVGRVGALCGCIHFYRGPCWITDNALYSKDFLIDIDREFFAYLLEFIDLAKFRAAGGQPLVSQGPIHAHEASVPQLKAEQRKIAEILRTWDDAIEACERLIDGFEKRFSATARRFFDPCHPTFEHRPNLWSEFELGDVFAERTEGGDPGDRLLSITMGGGIIDRDDVGRKDTSTDDKSSYKLILPGDIGYNTMRMWQGVCGLSTLRGIVSPAYTIVTPDNVNIAEKYAAHLFKSRRMVFDFERYSQGLTSDTWNLKFPAFSKIKVFLPPIDVQHQQAELLDVLKGEIEVLHRKREALANQKRGLMQKLLTGDWRVQIEKEPAHG